MCRSNNKLKGEIILNSIPLMTFFLQGIPEQVAVTTLAFTIAKVPIKWLKTIGVGSILAITALIVRKFPIPPGLHTLILLFMLFLFLIIWTKGNVFLAFLGSIFSVLALIVYEVVSVTVLMAIMGVTPDVFMSNTVSRTLIFEPQVIFLFLTAYLVKKLYLNKSKRSSYESF